MFLAIGFFACARPGTTYHEYLSTSNAPAQADVRFTFFRPNESFLDKLHAGGRSVRVKIDGQTSGYLRSGFKSFDLPSGKHTVGVDIWNTPGSCQLEINATAGSEYYFIIKQRTEQMLAETVAGVGGQFADSWANQCSGTFSIESVQKEVAASKFADLKKN